ncbi:hypothetical protein LTR94_038232, partial [Friedmanniomyces endolithicus]
LPGQHPRQVRADQGNGAQQVGRGGQARAPELPLQYAGRGHWRARYRFHRRHRQRHLAHLGVLGRRG